jgi:hypothetical protein
VLACKALHGRFMSTSHLQLPMTAQEYIQSKLEELRLPLDLSRPQGTEELVEAIFKFVASKKFRKYALTGEYARHIKNSIKEKVQNNRPINLTFLGGSYKLWRLDEAPESDWAELFSCMYFSRWAAPICAIYEPGVWFDFFLDDVIVSRINNISEEDVSAYRDSRQKILDFLKPYQPDNLRMTITGVGSQFPSRARYEELLEQGIQKLANELPGGLPKLTEAELATTTLNVKATPEQLADPKWREKVELVHRAYMGIKGATGYSTASDKIRVFTQPFPNGTCIAVCTTKDSIAKFWAGVGVLRPRDDSYRQLVLSPNQLENAHFTFEVVSINGLLGKNFKKIRLVK